MSQQREDIVQSIRLSKELNERISRWIVTCEPVASRPQAIKYLIAKGLQVVETDLGLTRKRRK
jgi:hypothetical protein